MRLDEIIDDRDLLLFVRPAESIPTWEIVSYDEFTRRFIPEFKGLPATWRELQLVVRRYQNPLYDTNDRIEFRKELIEYLSQRSSTRSLLAMPMPDLGTDNVAIARMPGFGRDFFFKPTANVISKHTLFRTYADQDPEGVERDASMTAMFRHIADRAGRTMQMIGSHAIWFPEAQVLAIDGGAI